MKINAISSVRVNSTNMNTRKNNSNRAMGQQSTTGHTTVNNPAFKGGFGAVVGGIAGAVAGGLLTVVTFGAASGAVLPLIAAGAVIGHNEEEKSNKEEQNKNNKK